MNQLTAIRTFAKPSYCPVRRTRIHNDRWYRVTFQNVETDPRCDYVGLGEGEYTQLLPGYKARQARDARLNHCNRIVEHTGSVYALYVTSYGSWRTDATYHADVNSLHAAVETARASHVKWLADVERERNQHVECLKLKPEDTWRVGSIADCNRCMLERGLDTFAYHVEKEA